MLKLHIFKKLHTGLLEYNFDVDLRTKNVGVFPELNAKKFETNLYRDR